MYQSQARPDLGRELVVQQQPKQHKRSSQIGLSAPNFQVPFSQSFHYSSSIGRFGALALLMGCVVATLSGCGGVTFAAAKAQTGTTATTTLASLSAISCGTLSLTGAQSKACSVYLSAPAPAPTTVALTSSRTALQVPTSVVVPQGSKTGGFQVVSQAVSQTVSVTITGKAGITTKSDVLTLYPAPAIVPTLSKVSCGTQTLTGPTTKACSVYFSAAVKSQTAVTLSSSNGALQVPTSVNVPAGATTGGFAITATAVSTTLTVTLTATEGGVSQTDVLQLEGTSSQPTTQHEVVLNWGAPTSSPVPLSGYHVYRSPNGGSNYQLLNSSVDVNTTYTDTAVQSGQTYDYIVKTVDTAGVESPPSNMTSVTIP